MRFTTIGLFAFAVAASAMPGHAALPQSVDITQQCGSQILACCSEINIYPNDEDRRAKRQLADLVTNLVGTVDGLLGALARPGDDPDSQSLCYSHETNGAVCKGTVACCPGNGNKCVAVSDDKHKYHE